MTTLDQAIKNTTSTWNGDVTYKSSQDALVDLFYFIGSSRMASSEAIAAKVNAALAQDTYATGMILLWARDCRGGAGERRVFHESVLGMPIEHAKGMIRMLPQLGYWKDVVRYVDYPATSELALDMIGQGLSDENQQGLVAKYLPRKGLTAVTIRRHMGLTPKQYRKMIVSMSDTVEQKVCAKQHAKINYSHVPSLAMNRHRKSFMNHDDERFNEFKAKVVKGEAKINASQLYPYDITAQVPFSYMHNYEPAVDRTLLNAQWKALPDYIGNSDERMISVVDVSGSMGQRVGDKVEAIDVATSLGLYTAYHAKGVFKNTMISFSARPSFIKVKGNDIVEDVVHLQKAEWGMNTDIDAVFDMILKAGVAHNVPESEMPTMILIMSDMQFDACASVKGTFRQRFKKAYEDAGYKMPKLVFWNINASGRGVPTTSKDIDVGLVSGFSPSIFKSVLSAKDFTPRGILNETVINNDRYVYEVGQS